MSGEDRRTAGARTAKPGAAKRLSYRCTSGHLVAADAPMGACPVFVLGMPCTGALVPISRNQAADLFTRPSLSTARSASDSTSLARSPK